MLNRNNNDAIKTLVLFTVGYYIYSIIEIVFRGYTYSLMGICAGLSILLLDKINDNISWDVDILLQGAIGSIIITSMELIVGNLMYACPWIPIMWDYHNQWMNYNGIVCPLFSFLWLLLSIVAILVADAINYIVLKDNDTPYYVILGKIIIPYK